MNPAKGECYTSISGLFSIRVVGVGKYSAKVVHLDQSASSGREEILEFDSSKFFQQIDCPEDFK